MSTPADQAVDPPHRRALAGVLLALALVLAACSGDDPDLDPDRVAGPSAVDAEADPGVVYAGYSSDVYAVEAAWICRPDLHDDVCRDLDTTRIQATGKRSVKAQSPAADPPIDCFYIYPTASLDEGINSDRLVGPDAPEVLITRAQAAHPGSTVD